MFTWKELSSWAWHDTIWLVVWNMNFIVHHIWDVILPIDELIVIFFRGVAVETTNQLSIPFQKSWVFTKKNAKSLDQPAGIKGTSWKIRHFIVGKSMKNLLKPPFRSGIFRPNIRSRPYLRRNKGCFLWGITRGHHGFNTKRCSNLLPSGNLT